MKEGPVKSMAESGVAGLAPAGQTAMSKPGTFGHGGAFGTQAWIDPQSGVALILMIQRANFRNSDDSPVRLAFQTAAVGKP